MKRIVPATVIVTALIAYGISASTPAQASTLQTENLILTLPDSISISGTEVGGSNNPRKCSITASLDSKSGTTIPLRAGAVVNLVDSTGFGIDNGYAIADVEGLTHLDIVMVFKCGNGIGTATIKGPYKFTTIWRGMSGLPFAPDTPVNVTFGMTAPAPSPTTSANDSTKDALASALDKIAALSSANAALASQVASLTSQLATASKVSEKQPDSSSKILTNCYRIAQSIAISKKGTLSKICLNL